MNILNHPTNDQLSLTYVPLHNRVTMSVLENILVVGQLMASCSVAWYSVSKMFKKVEKKLQARSSFTLNYRLGAVSHSTTG